jgi:thymidylate synthase ThyX
VEWTVPGSDLSTTSLPPSGVAVGVAPGLQNVMLPAELLEDPEAEQIYSEAVQDCVTHYRTIFLNLTEIFKKEIPQSDFKTEAGWENACRAKALDLSRGLLPAGSKASLGMTVNGRELAHMLRKLLASPLGEVGAVAARLHEEGVKILPTLVRHVAPSDYRLRTRALAEEVWGLLKEATPLLVSSYLYMRGNGTSPAGPSSTRSSPPRSSATTWRGGMCLWNRRRIGTG